MGPPVYCPYLRRLERLTISLYLRVLKKMLSIGRLILIVGLYVVDGTGD